jgi:hypothetical protein
VSNGSAVLPGVDGRSREARRYRDLLDSFVIEHNAMAEAELCLARRAAGLSVWLEQQEALAAKGKAIDIGAVTTATNSLRRLLDDLAASSRARGRNQRGTA